MQNKTKLSWLNWTFNFQSSSTKTDPGTIIITTVLIVLFLI